MQQDISRKSYITLEQAHSFKEEVLKKWKPAADVWAFKFGDVAIGYLSTFGSLLITFIYRKELKLRPYAKLTCYVPVVGVSGLASFVFNDLYVSTSIIASNTSCPICVSAKASFGQLILGVAYPMVAGAIVCFNVADRIMTYPVPPLLKAPKEVFQLFKKIIYKNPRPYLVLSALHIAATSFVTYSKQNTLLKLDSELRRPLD